MITAHLHGAQEPLTPTQPIQEFPDRQPSSVERCAHQRISCGQAVIASLRRKGQIRGAQTHLSSFEARNVLTPNVSAFLGHVADPDGDFRQPFAGSLGFCLALHRGDDGFYLLGIHRNASSGFGVGSFHCGVSLVDSLNIGPAALSSQEVIAP